MKRVKRRPDSGLQYLIKKRLQGPARRAFKHLQLQLLDDDPDLGTLAKPNRGNGHGITLQYDSRIPTLSSPSVYLQYRLSRI